jgi:nucleoside-diphosphate-sugar epimerase
VERTVVVSSSLAQGPTGSASAPAGAYGRSRLQAEAMARRHLEQGDPVVVLRPHIVIDERPCIFEPQFASLAAGGTLPWPVAWNAVHHLIHTDDLVAACRRALAAGAAGFYGVGSRVTGTLRQHFARLAERHGVELRVRTRGVRRLVVLRRLEVLCGCCLLGPAELLLHTKGLRYDLGAAARGLGWQPRRTDAEILHDAFAAHLSRTAAAATGRPR